MPDSAGGVLATLVSVEGSSYRRPGARLLVTPDGARIGSISGGCLERDIAERVSMWLADMNPRLVTYDSTRGDDLIFQCHSVVAGS